MINNTDRTQMQHNQETSPRIDQQRVLPRSYLGGAFLVLCFILIITGILVLSGQYFVWERVTLASVVFLFFSTALAERSFETRQKEKPWNELATRLGLTYDAGSLLSGQPVRVLGTYRGYKLSLYTSKQARGNLCTRIEIVLKTPTKDYLRLRGPYAQSEIASETAFTNVFGARSLYQIGYERFFVRSLPFNLAHSLFGTDGRRHGPLRYRLLAIKNTANIELDEQRLHFEQFGALTDIDYVQSLFDLLCDIAATIEETAVDGVPQPPTG